MGTTSGHRATRNGIRRCSSQGWNEETTEEVERTLQSTEPSETRRSYVFKTGKGKLFTANYDKVRPYHARIMDNKVRPGDGEFALIGADGDITEIEPTEAASTIHSEWTENSSEDPDAEDVTTLSEPSVRKDYPLRSKQQRYARRQEINPNYIPREKDEDPQTQPSQKQIRDLP